MDRGRAKFTTIHVAVSRALFEITKGKFQPRLQRSTFNCDSTVQQRFVISASKNSIAILNAQLRFQLSTVILFFNSQLRFFQPRFDFSTLTCDSKFQPRFDFSTLNCDSNFQPRFDFSTLNCDCNFQPRFGFSTLNCDSFQRSTAIGLFNAQLRFELPTAICNFSVPTVIPNAV